jgi:hypothetical protein
LTCAHEPGHHGNEWRRRQINALRISGPKQGGKRNPRSSTTWFRCTMPERRSSRCA